MFRNTAIAAIVATLALGAVACEKQGPAEKVGEKLDKAGRTIANGGKETTGDKLDDAGDHIREGANDAADAVTDHK